MKKEQPMFRTKGRTNRKIFSNLSVPVTFVILMTVFLTGCSSLGGGEETPVAPAMLEITDPNQGTLLNTFNPISVSGVGANLPEDNIVVQALDRDGTVLAETSVKLTASGAGTPGTWAAELIVDQSSYTNGKLTAFSPSPENGQPLTVSTINVVYNWVDPQAQRIRLEDHLWYLQAFGDQEKIPDSFITAEFARQLSGVSGCNQYYGYYESAFSSLNVRQIVPTNMVCDAPEGVMEQEIHYLSLLEQVSFFRVEDCRLEIYNKTEELLLSYDAVVLGGIFNDQSVQIPPGAIATVTLEDVSLADAPATAIAEETVVDSVAFPVPFIVTYCADEIQSNHTYNLRAKINDEDGNLLFTTTSAFPVITSGNPTVIDLVVESVQ